jgi:hypothetical protein
VRRAAVDAVQAVVQNSEEFLDRFNLASSSSQPVQNLQSEHILRVSLEDFRMIHGKPGKWHSI